MLRKPRPALSDRIDLWLSDSRYVDGLWLGVQFVDTGRNTEPIFQRVEAALHLIKTYAPIRYNRLRRDIERVWVRRQLSMAGGCFNRALGACELDSKYLLAETTTVEAIASLIVHEAIHARLEGCGIGYEEHLRARVEAVCIRRQRAFGRAIPNGEDVCAFAEYNLESYAVPENLSQAAFSRNYAEGRIVVARELGFPEWLIRTLVACGRGMYFLRTGWMPISRLLSWPVKLLHSKSGSGEKRNPKSRNIKGKGT